jgi:hypothetical protein
MNFLEWIENGLFPNIYMEIEEDHKDCQVLFLFHENSV